MRVLRCWGEGVAVVGKVQCVRGGFVDGECSGLWWLWYGCVDGDIASGGGSLEEVVGHTACVIIYYDVLINNFNLQLMSDGGPPVILAPYPSKFKAQTDSFSRLIPG